MKFLVVLDVWAKQSAENKQTLKALIDNYESEGKQEVNFSEHADESKILPILKQIPEAEMSEFNMFYFEKVHNKYEEFDRLAKMIVDNNLLSIVDAIRIKYLVFDEWSGCDINGGFLDALEEYIFKQHESIISTLNDKLDAYESENTQLKELALKQQKLIEDLLEKRKKRIKS